MLMCLGVLLSSHVSDVPMQRRGKALEAHVVGIPQIGDVLSELLEVLIKPSGVKWVPPQSVWWTIATLSISNRWQATLIESCGAPRPARPPATTTGKIVGGRADLLLAVLVDELEDFAWILLAGQRFGDGVGNAARDPRVETVNHDCLQVRNDLTKVCSRLPLIKSG